MTQEIEIEYKNLLTETEYTQLLHALPFSGSGIWQTNHYFETKDFQLKANNAALRIREKDGNYVLTLKQPHPDGLLESHDTLVKAEAASWLTGNPFEKQQVAKQLATLGIDHKDLVYYGKLTTKRHELDFQDTLIVLDYSIYNDTSDYELEIEAKTKSDGLAMIRKVMKEHGITEKETPNKIKRFFTSLTFE